MKIINKHTGVEVRTLTCDENINILPDNRGGKEAQLLMQSIQFDHCWLKCDCTNEGAIMFVRNYDQHFSLVCHSKQGQHNKDCPHFRQIENSSVFDKARTERAMERQAQNYTSVSFCEDFATEKKVSKSAVSTNGRRASAKRVPKLTTLALFLIKQSQQHLIHSNSNYYNQHTKHALQRFQQAAIDIKFGNSTLDDWISIGKESYSSTLKRLYAIEKEGIWPKKQRPHAFMCFVASKLVMNDEEAGTVSITVDDKSKFYLKRLLLEHQGLRTEGPYLVFIMICRPTIDRKYQSHTAYVKPIVNKNWLMPVDSNYERKFAKRALYHLQKGQDWTLEKALEGKAYDNCYLLPDFMISHPQHKHLIEIMGMLDNQDYLDRKDYIVPRMKEAWPNHTLFELDPTSIDVTKYIANLEVLTKKTVATE